MSVAKLSRSTGQWSYFRFRQGIPLFNALVLGKVYEY